MPKKNKKGKGLKPKATLDSLPTSDDDRETADNWSTASILSDEGHSSLSEEGAGPDESSAQENFEDKLKDCIDGLAEKSAQTRKTALDGVMKALSKKYIMDFLLERKVTLTDYLLKCLKKGKGDEQVLAARCLSLLCIQMGLEAEDIFNEIQPQLLTAMTDNSVALKARSQCAIGLAVCNFVSCTDIDIVVKVLDALEGIFKTSYRKGDKSIPSHTPDTTHLHASALSGWSLLLSIAPSFLVMKCLGKHIDHLPDLLHSSDVELRIEAGETLALLYELAREEDEDFEGKDIDNLCETLKKLATDSNKYRAKKDRRQQRSSFRDVLRAVEEGDVPDLTIKFGTESVVIDSWTRKKQYDAFCLVLGSGVYQHLQDNIVVREVFGLGAPIPVGTKPVQKITKWERTHYNAAAFKALTKARSKHRDKRSVMVNGD
ncbi:interferon-related developmental regulator 1-like [Saccostrea echinata]|uniref:interferon-related developmental regulator 1-like n=1 Tax=Saccostrea echinata TaxID=191078 RepID=UPI002A8333FA|nr:interferon-related developmental regulator 1-like [Saccostrea echinata]